MLKLRNISLILASGLFAIFVIGCGRGDGPKLVEVKGKVTVGGSTPFANGIVRFSPRTAGKLASGAAVTNGDGTFAVKFQGTQKNGVQPGDYDVSFALWKMPDGSPLPESSDGEARSPAELGGVNYVPVEYSKMDSSKYPVTVTAKGGSFDFDIPELKPQVQRQARR